MNNRQCNNMDEPHNIVHLSGRSQLQRPYTIRFHLYAVSIETGSSGHLSQGMWVGWVMGIPAANRHVVSFGDEKNVPKIRLW